eukprot:TRINITY_DN59738_c0_g1_i3.p1 TRINITY_DN59738_c0_g1~~TRINITY_DN59738_c0_g1_i3.p1  ORF type:complete len:157 (-),score=10.19 TRINITY_DN59738_c0_g1_i3:36-506(-)
MDELKGQLTEHQNNVMSAMEGIVSNSVKCQCDLPMLVYLQLQLLHQQQQGVHKRPSNELLVHLLIHVVELLCLGLLPVLQEAQVQPQQHPTSSAAVGKLPGCMPNSVVNFCTIPLILPISVAVGTGLATKAAGTAGTPVLAGIGGTGIAFAIPDSE